MSLRRHNCPTCGAEFEYDAWSEQVQGARREEEDSGRVLVRITSYRCRLIDRDNLCGKYFLDALRYARILRDDTEEEIDYKIRQVPVSMKSDERTEIEIIRTKPYEPLVKFK